MSESPPEPKGAIATFGLTLPIGFQNQGVHFKDFELGPLRGKLRRELMNAVNPFKATALALKHAITRLGKLEGPAMQFIQAIPAPDVEYLHLLLSSRECHGKVQVETTCGDEAKPTQDGCGAAIKRHVILSDVVIIEASAPVLFNEHGQPYQELFFHDPATDKEIMVKYRVPLLGDQEMFWEKLRSMQDTPGDLVQHQMSSLMLDWDRRGTGLSFSELDNLDFRTYDAMTRAAKDRHPTHIDTDVIVQCPKCLREHEVPLPVSQWLDPFEAAAPSPS